MVMNRTQRTDKFSRIFVTSLTAWWLLAAVNVWAAPNEPVVPHQTDDVAKVVYHADFADPRRFSAMLTSIKNMVSVYRDDLVDYDVRIVFVSYGIRFVTWNKLIGTPFAEDADLIKQRENLLGRLASLRDTYGVKLEVCGITLEQAGLDVKDILPGVQFVRSGVVQIAELQRQGFAYIKIE